MLKAIMFILLFLFFILKSYAVVLFVDIVLIIWCILGWEPDKWLLNHNDLHFFRILFVWVLYI